MQCHGLGKALSVVSRSTPKRRQLGGVDYDQREGRCFHRQVSTINVLMIRNPNSLINLAKQTRWRTLLPQVPHPFNLNPLLYHLVTAFHLLAHSGVSETPSLMKRFIVTSLYFGVSSCRSG